MAAKRRRFWEMFQNGGPTKKMGKKKHRKSKKSQQPTHQGDAGASTQHPRPEKKKDENQAMWDRFLSARSHGNLTGWYLEEFGDNPNRQAVQKLMGI